ncbi:MAG: histidine kinase [Bacteroidetes bacterium]|nr:MAG: histidine kinase [Bacteroidota bacterium]
MDEKKKEARYERLLIQLEALLRKTEHPLSRMASVCAVLHHKMDHYFWTGFYLVRDERLYVGPYQGPVACQELAKPAGVCWTAVLSKKAVIVPDVDAFPGHVGCDTRSRSEIALPVCTGEGEPAAVFDVDADFKNAFTETDQKYLEKILALIYR